MTRQWIHADWNLYQYVLRQKTVAVVVHNDPWTLWYVTNQYKTQEMCEKAFEEDLGLLWPVPDQYKTQKMCDKVVEEDLCLLEYVPAWFVKQQ